jgi:NhaP-type Na+/H+ or K+/H+ antiporter
MFEILFKIWFLIAILPVLMVQRGYEIYKEYMHKHNRPIDWIHFVYVLLALLIIILIVLLIYGYPW